MHFSKRGPEMNLQQGPELNLVKNTTFSQISVPTKDLLIKKAISLKKK